MKNRFLILVGISIFFFSCKKEMKIEEVKTDSLKTVIDTILVDTIVKNGHNSKNALDWYGIYKGIVPCADCEGIDTEITLTKDMMFILKTKYLGKGDQTVFEKKGTFTWDATGAVISLNDLKGSPNKYKVGENKLTQLDMEGKEISGTLAEKYILKK
jgi:uncharacterized lipoprotein NlpE involved in copper resistance